MKCNKEKILGLVIVFGVFILNYFISDGISRVFGEDVANPIMIILWTMIYATLSCYMEYQKQENQEKTLNVIGIWMKAFFKVIALCALVGLILSIIIAFDSDLGIGVANVVMIVIYVDIIMRCLK